MISLEAGAESWPPCRLKESFCRVPYFPLLSISQCPGKRNSKIYFYNLREKSNIIRDSSDRCRAEMCVPTDIIKMFVTCPSHGRAG